MSSTKPPAQPAATPLRLDWATHQAAKYAVEHWHYSRSLPAGKLVKIGVWEGERFIGVVLFSRGANNHIGSPYGLKQTEVCELTRIALDKHTAPVTRIVRIALSMLTKVSPGLRLVVSYADADQDHEGKIYQAGNWLYEGHVNEGSRSAFIIHGKKVHPKTVHSLGVKQSLEEVRKHLDPKATLFVSKGKHKYLMPLDEDMRQWLHLRGKQS